MSSPPENADEKTQIKEIPNTETQNRDTLNSETQNNETQNNETQNRETQNSEIQNNETQNNETQNRETQNREIQNRETQNREIPADIIWTKILPSLPAISLLRFKRVCKEWKLLISSSEFIIKHIRHPNYISSKSVLSISHNTSLTAVDYGDSQNVQMINFGRYSTTNPIFLIGSCNGLVLLIRSHALNGQLPSPSHLLKFGFEYRVCNPVLNHDVVIRQPPGVFLESNHFAAKDYSFGFGCVSTDDSLEFFVVAISFQMGYVLVFESSTRKWDTMQTLRENLHILFEDAWYIHSGTLVNQALHWGVSIAIIHKRIVVLDLVNRNNIKFMKLPYPNFGEPDIVRSAFSLGCINDRLCAWAYYKGGYEVDMWMMNEYNVRESWTSGAPVEARPLGFGYQIKAVNYVQSLVSPHTVFLDGEQNG
ncbi:F-box protein CPR30-like [Chenopodium quinoa]|uniref:F-box protein CPR30-like n=1 Tax=Chenopodium quinoa TaxID=63459 RepID=UPI000B799789|nr:F-box protein CPR30-like [Chenopodium quinoa]